MIYLASRAACQGRAAGFVSLAGVALGFVVYLLLAALGITAVQRWVMGGVLGGLAVRMALRSR